MNKGRLEGKNAIVSGGAAGAGGAASEIFAREGAFVAIVDIQEKVGADLAKRICDNNGKAFFIKCDVSISGEVETAVAKINKRFGENRSFIFIYPGVIELFELGFPRGCPHAIYTEATLFQVNLIHDRRCASRNQIQRPFAF